MEKPSDLYQIMDAHPFATMITLGSTKPEISHLPLVHFKDAEGALRLAGHFSRKNPHARSLKAGGTVLAVFQGPHCFVDPRWYAAEDVPTWNYIVVHVTGAAQLVEDAAGIRRILELTTEKVNEGKDNPWAFKIPADLQDDEALTEAICGFEIKVLSIQGRFKLSQNRSAKDRMGVITGLGQCSDEGSRGIREWMLKSVPPGIF